ncbi:MAG: hypothetical protein K2K21_15380 [Lachnospiraceae bacterium]|nr:hypothetical protein [Lachnospiraceae bacterium]
MNKIVNKHQAICGIVWIVIFGIIIFISLSHVTEKPIVQSNQQMSMQSDAIRGDYLAAQGFVAPYSHLKDIKIYFLSMAAGEEFRFILFDAEWNVVLDKNITVEDTEEISGLYTITLDQDMEAGGEYYYMIQGISTDFYVAYEDTETSGMIYNGTLFYNGMEVKGHNIITEYDYEIPLGKGKAFVCYAFVVLFGLLISFLSKKYYEKHPEKNCLLTVEKVWKSVASPIVIISAVICMFAIWPCNLFKNEAGNHVRFDALDIIFFDTGVLIAAGIMLYGIHHKRYHKSNDMGLSVLRDRWADYLQSAFLALAIQSTVHYMNGLYENQHIIAYREMLIYFGLAVIVTYKRKEIFNWVNLIYLVIAAIAGPLYYHAQAVSVETEDEMQILRLTIWAAVVAGIVIINTIFILVRRQIGKISGYGIMVAFFFALLIIFRNTRGWTIYLTCIFSLYYLRISAWDKKDRLLGNICNGVLIHFLVMTVYCLMHRPYLFFQHSRYPFIFHTVTVTAEYLSLVVCAAFVKLLQAYHREARLSYIWKELTIFGISTVYLILTLTRTGYLAAIVMLIVVVPFVYLSMRCKIKILSTVAMLSAVVIVCFPAVFTLQRIVPAVVAQPEKFEIEWIPDDLKNGRNMDGGYYMTIRRFVQLFEMRVLGIPEGKCVKSTTTVKNDRNSDIMLVASLTLSGMEFSHEEEDAQAETDMDSYANGRLEIFKMYIENLNMKGHDEMSIIMPDGTEKGGHAHNTYIQTAYDHGIPIGIVFVIFIVCTLVQSAVYYKKRKYDITCSLFPFALLITFATAGMTEWIFHPCNPLAFSLLLSLAPLLCSMDGKTRSATGSI